MGDCLDMVKVKHTGHKSGQRKPVKKDDVKDVVDKVFNIFDKNKDCVIKGAEVAAVDLRDKISLKRSCQMYLDTLSAYDFLDAAGKKNIDPKKKEKRMSYIHFNELLGGRFEQDIRASKIDAYMHLTDPRYKAHLKELKSYLEGI